MHRSLAIVILASMASLPVPAAGAAPGTELVVDVAVEETPQDILFHVVAVDLQTAPEAPQAESVRYDVYFTYVDREYLLRINRGVDVTGVYYWSSLWVYDADRGGYDSAHRDNPVHVDAGQGLMRPPYLPLVSGTSR